MKDTSNSKEYRDMLEKRKGNYTWNGTRERDKLERIAANMYAGMMMHGVSNAIQSAMDDSTRQ